MNIDQEKLAMEMLKKMGKVPSPRLSAQQVPSNQKKKKPPVK